MRRWTDGKSWSASRVSGSFLTYREMEGKRGGSSFAAAPKAPTSKEHDGTEEGPDGYRYKPDGLIKQSFSITTSTGQHLHLISYFARSTTVSQNLQQPSSDAQLRHIRPEKGMYPESTVHDQNAIPAVTRGPMTSPAFAHQPHQPANVGGQYPPRPHYTHGPTSYGPPGWAPPSPMHTPPPHYSPYGYHPSPMQHLHPSQYPPQQPSHPQHYPPPPPPINAFDRPPAPLSNNSLPAPPSHLHPQLTPIHSHPPTLPQLHQAHRPSLNDISPRTSSHGVASIDPALANNHYDSRLGPSLPSPRSIDTTAGAQHTSEGVKLPSATSSSGTTIPSISSLIHETSNPQSLNAGRPTSRSPIGGRPQDIPIHKMGYDAARDVQALRHLDKATLRF
jgi:hypothetical protein